MENRVKHVSRESTSPAGCVAIFKKRQESDGSGRAGAVSCNHPEQLVDELNLSPTIRPAHPPRLPLPDHVHGLVALDRSPRRVECTKALLGRHASFDRSMIRLHDVVHVLDRSVAATASGVGAQPFGCDEAAVGSLATVTATGARSRDEIKGPSEVQDEVSRGELVSVRAGLGPARGRDAVALCRRHGRVAPVAVRSTRRAEDVLGLCDRDGVDAPPCLPVARAPSGRLLTALSG